MRLGRSFDEGDDGPGGWWILDEPELHLLSDEIVVPDLAGWCIERMKELPETPYFSLPPDWLCEILSPSTEANDRAEKMPVYALAGVCWIWLIDPVLKTLEIFRLDEKAWTMVKTHKGDSIVRAEPFDAIELEMGALWATPVKRAR